jgi:hypothetical protein
MMQKSSQPHEEVTPLLDIAASTLKRQWPVYSQAPGGLDDKACTSNALGLRLARLICDQ